ncbi:right-handed parallel beta-helix repeat-containing protein [Streptomyces sp. NPDC046332]|uniref:right-handed parallel beta-helix repeat-containing protein n=1 Tax=unclassified Streptomyces TaxID=2593676 RepID=UPI003403CD84
MQIRIERAGGLAEPLSGGDAPRARRARAVPCAFAAVLLTTAAGCAALPEPYVPPRPNAAKGFTFYVSPHGDDDNDGLAPDRAWRTLLKADAVTYKPGDRLRLLGGVRHRGTLTLGPREAGSASRPVVVESYGTGRATIEAAGTEGISVYNTGGVEVRDIAVVGDDRAYATSTGIKFFSDRPDEGKHEHVVVADVDVSRFRTGITLAGAEPGSGFRDVRITDSTLHGNRDAGLSTVGPVFDAKRPEYSHERLSVVRVQAYGNDGDPKAATRNTGSGIMLGSVREAKIQRSTAHHNGRKSSARATEGPEGIWAYDSTRVVVEHSVSYANRTGSHVDGGGFGLDNNTSASVLQYNLAYGNDGPGYLVYTREATDAHRQNVVRFNLSHDDSRKLPLYGGIVAYGGRVSDLDIYHNTVVMRTTDRDGEDAPALRLDKGLKNVRVQNNIFVTDGAPVVASTVAFKPAVVTLQGNDYFSTGEWRVRWGDDSFWALGDWRTAARQERAGSTQTGTDADPCLHGTEAPLTSVKGAVMLVPGCPRELTEAALNLRSFGVDPGSVDYFGEYLPPTAAAGAAQPTSDE